MGFKVGHLFGFPIRVDPTAIILIVLFGTMASTPVEGAMIVINLALAILLHELGHAFVVRGLGGDPEITLHGLGGLTTHHLSPTNGQQFVISVAGPLVNGVLAGLGFLGLAFVAAPGTPLASFFFYWLWVNALLGLFNLLPIVPLDGGHALRSVLRRFLPKRADTVASWISVALATPIAAWGLANQEVFLLLIAAFLVLSNVRILLAERSD